MSPLVNSNIGRRARDRRALSDYAYHGGGSIVAKNESDDLDIGTQEPVDVLDKRGRRRGSNVAVRHGSSHHGLEWLARRDDRAGRNRRNDLRLVLGRQDRHAHARPVIGESDRGGAQLRVARRDDDAPSGGVANRPPQLSPLETRGIGNNKHHRTGVGKRGGEARARCQRDDARRCPVVVARALSRTAEGEGTHKDLPGVPLDAHRDSVVWPVRVDVGVY